MPTVSRPRSANAAVAACLALALGGSPLAAAEINFKQDTAVAKIFEICAALGKFNVIVSPLVRAKMSLNLSQVDPLEVIYIVANVHNLKVKRLVPRDSQSGSPADRTDPRSGFLREAAWRANPLRKQHSAK